MYARTYCPQLSAKLAPAPKSSDSINFQDPESIRTNGISNDPKTMAAMLVLFSQLTYDRDNLACLAQCDVIPTLCQALEKYPGELPIIRAALKVFVITHRERERERERKRERKRER